MVTKAVAGTKMVAGMLAGMVAGMLAGVEAAVLVRAIMLCVHTVTT